MMKIRVNFVSDLYFLLSIENYVMGDSLLI
jgi:hypothetical protein